MALRQRLYEYGWLAWVWRALMVVFIVIGGGAAIGGLTTLEVWMLVVAVVLLLPVVFFGTVVVVTLDRETNGDLDVQTLLFVRRRIPAGGLGAARVRVKYRTTYQHIHAPRVWVQVKGGVPLYFDLLGRILDRSRFLATIGVRAREIVVAD